MAASQEQTGREVEISAGHHRLMATLNVPEAPRGVVAFAHGSGSGRFSARNRFVAGVLQEAGLATLLLDLLEQNEENDRARVFDIELLAERLQAAGEWLGRQPETSGLRLGYFGASTGAGAALVAAALDGHVYAVVSRGGRPDLAQEYLGSVQAPTLLIVGGNDDIVIELNEEALARLRCAKELVIIPGATHLFSEPGTLEEVARFAKDWFLQHLAHS